MMGRWWGGGLVLALVLAIGRDARATDYWVKNGGSDGASGLSTAAAWATLNHAAGLVNPGDTVHALDGSYQGFDLRRSGTAANPITFRAEGSSTQITADNGTTPDGINVENAAYVVIDGFVVNNRTRAGIRVAVSQFVTVQNCHTGFNCTWGIFSGFADDFTIENNETHHSQTQHGIYVSNTCTRPIVRGNDVHDNYANGIHMNGDQSEGGVGMISNALVEDNVIHGNGVGGGSGINMDGVKNSVIQNNLLYDNHASGISLYRIDAAAGSSGNLVVNNTIVVASDGRWAVNINTGSTGNTVRNNVLWNLHSWHGAITIDSTSRAGFHSDHNAVISRFSTDGGDTVLDLAAWQALGYDASSFVADPSVLFVNPGSDFHLLPTAPAVDAGSPTGAPALDLDGNPRPAGGGFDVGAYELQLLQCGNGHLDPGEQCEQDTDCGAGEVCQACACVNAPACASGIVLQNPWLTMKPSPFSLRLSGQAVIPKPWRGVDPLQNGIRIVVDAISGPGGVDVTIPGGSGWKVNPGHTQWTFSDRLGAHGGITRVVVTDRSRVTDGLLHLSAQGKTSAPSLLPDVAHTRAAAVFGAADECAQVEWNPPGDALPSCRMQGPRLVCR
jgi:hypothetical protein